MSSSEDLTPAQLVEEWNTFETTMIEAAEKDNPEKRKKKKQKWMNDKILDMMEQRRQVEVRDPIKYKGV